MTFTFDERDQQIRDERLSVWDKIEGPRVGDWVILPDGDYRRFTHDWGDGMQTTVRKDKGHYNASFYFGKGYMEFSGSLDPSIKKDCLTLTDETKAGSIWFFHHGEVGAHRGVYSEVPCRVYKYT